MGSPYLEYHSCYIGAPAQVRLVNLLLVAMTLAVFWPVLTHDFVNLDDNLYVTGNLRVQAGLSLSNLAWAFTANHIGFWYPLTLASHMLDIQLFGLSPWGHHLTNLLIHIANVLLLFAVLRRMTKDIWRSAFVAAIFAVHPLQVETVAWVSERKNLLSTLFCLLALLAYVAQIERPARGRYAAVWLCFAAALMSKAAVIFLPILMIILDYWPLGRWRQGWRISIWEKIPLFVIAVAAAITTLLFSQLKPLAVLPFTFRLANAAVAVTTYLQKTFWPTSLAVYYPHPGKSVDLWWGLAAGLLLCGISMAIIRSRRNKLALCTGWLWFLTALAPMLGLIQVGSQAMADHYAYVPLIGLGIMAAWALPASLTRASALGAVCLLSLAMIATSLQVRYWRNSVTLFEHALEINEANPLIHNDLGIALYMRGNLAGAISHYRRAITLLSVYAPGENHFDTSQIANNLGVALARQGDLAEAKACFIQAANTAPDQKLAQDNLAQVQALLRKHFPAKSR